MRDTTRPHSTLPRRALVGGGGAALAGLGFRPEPAGAQQSILWYSASASAADEDWSKLFKAKTGVGVEYFRIGGVKLTERIEQEARASRELQQARREAAEEAKREAILAARRAGRKAKKRRGR